MTNYCAISSIMYMFVHACTVWYCDIHGLNHSVLDVQLNSN